MAGKGRRGPKRKEENIRMVARNITMPKWMLDWLEAEALRRDETVSGLIREAVQNTWDTEIESKPAEERIAEELEERG